MSSRYQSIIDSYYGNAQVALFFFDLNNVETLVYLNVLMQRISASCQPFACILVGCKCDLPTQVTQQQIDQFVQQHSKYALEYIETSCQSMHNIDKLRRILHFRLRLAYDHHTYSAKPSKTTPPATTTTCQVQ